MFEFDKKNLLVDWDDNHSFTKSFALSAKNKYESE